MQRSIILGFILTLIIVIFFPVYWATEPQRQAGAATRFQSEAAGRGAARYTTDCVACHGPEGQGSIGPALRETPLNEDALAKVITRGVPGTDMAAFGQSDGGAMKDHEVGDMVTFILNWDIGVAAAAEEAAAEAEASHDGEAAPGDDGEQIFAQKCLMCHSIGRGNGVGPDLSGVTEKRDREWLLRFILTPEVLIAEDPVAKQLVDEYNGLQMPNSGLSEAEAEAVLAYLESAAK